MTTLLIIIAAATILTSPAVIARMCAKAPLDPNPECSRLDHMDGLK